MARPALFGAPSERITVRVRESEQLDSMAAKVTGGNKSRLVQLLLDNFAQEEDPVKVLASDLDFSRKSNVEKAKQINALTDEIHVLKAKLKESMRKNADNIRSLKAWHRQCQNPRLRSEAMKLLRAALKRQKEARADVAELDRVARGLEAQAVLA